MKKHTLTSDAIGPRVCTLSRRLQVLHSSAFFKHLQGDDVQRISGLFRERAASAGQTIYVAGERATHMYVVAAGKIKLTRTTPDGTNVIIEWITPGNFFGMLSTLGYIWYPDTAVAHTHSCILGITAAHFEEVLQRHPGVAAAALQILAARVRELHQTIEELSAHSVEQRIASALSRLAERLGEKQNGAVLIQMPLSQQDLADMTGTTRETASRTLQRFRKAGLIRTGSRWIAIIDERRLAQVATASRSAGM